MIQRLPKPLNEIIKAAHAEARKPEMLYFTLLGPREHWTGVGTTHTQDMIRYWFEDSTNDHSIRPFFSVDRAQFCALIQTAIAERCKFDTLPERLLPLGLTAARSGYGYTWTLLRYLLDYSYLIISGDDVYLLPHSWTSFEANNHFDKPKIKIENNGSRLSFEEALSARPDLSRSIAFRVSPDITSSDFILGEYGDVIFGDQLPESYSLSVLEKTDNPLVNANDNVKFYSVNSPLRKEMFPVETNELNEPTFNEFVKNTIGLTSAAYFAVAQIEVPIYNLSSIPAFGEVAVFTRSKNVLVTTLTSAHCKRWTKPGIVLDQILNTFVEALLAGTYSFPNSEAFTTWNIQVPRFENPIVVESDLSQTASYFKMIELSRLAKSDDRWAACEVKQKQIIDLNDKKGELEARISSLAFEIQNSIQAVAEHQGRILRSESAKSTKTQALNTVANQLALLNQANDSMQELLSHYKNTIDQRDLQEFVTKAANLNFKISKLVFTPRSEPHNEKVINFDRPSGNKPLLDQFAEVIEKNYNFTRIYVSTIRPSIVKDSKSDNQVIAGPFDIDLQRGQMSIRSSSGYSYGSKNIRLHKKGSANRIEYMYSYKCHPHSAAMPAATMGPIATFPSSWVSFCLGEAQTLFYHAFEKKDYSSLLIILKSLLETFNSRDAWGANWVNFVKYHNQSFEGYKINGIN